MAYFVAQDAIEGAAGDGDLTPLPELLEEPNGRRLTQAEDLEADTKDVVLERRPLRARELEPSPVQPRYASPACGSIDPVARAGVCELVARNAEGSAHEIGRPADLDEPLRHVRADRRRSILCVDAS